MLEMTFITVMITLGDSYQLPVFVIIITDHILQLSAHLFSDYI